MLKTSRKPSVLTTPGADMQETLPSIKKPQQPFELDMMLKLVAGCSSILEIGSRYGYTLLDIAHVMQPGSKIVSIDIPDPRQPNVEAELATNLSRLRKEGYKVTHINTNSHDKHTIDNARSNGPYDIVFIDADHSEKACMLDWTNYSPMATKFILFHDIVSAKSGYGVDKVWAHVKSKHKTTIELVHKDVKKKMGIGVVVLGYNGAKT